MGYECLDRNPVSQIQKSGLNTALALTDLTVRSITSDQIRTQYPHTPSFWRG
jgi:hypothetical protein